METERIVMTSTFYPPYHLGGDAMHVKYLADELTKLGHEVHVIHSIDAYELKVHEKNPPPLSDEANVHSIHSTMGSASAALSFITGKNRAAERMLESVVKDVHPDWVHHHNISLLGINMMDIAKCPQIYTAHDHWLVCQRNDLMYCGKYACTSNKCFSCSLRSRRPPQTWRSSLIDHLKRMSIVIAPSNYLADVPKERIEIDQWLSLISFRDRRSRVTLICHRILYM